MAGALSRNVSNKKMDGCGPEKEDKPRGGSGLFSWLRISTQKSADGYEVMVSPKDAGETDNEAKDARESLHCTSAGTLEEATGAEDESSSPEEGWDLEPLVKTKEEVLKLLGKKIASQNQEDMRKLITDGTAHDDLLVRAGIILGISFDDMKMISAEDISDTIYTTFSLSSPAKPRM